MPLAKELLSDDHICFQREFLDFKPFRMHILAPDRSSSYKLSLQQAAVGA